MYRQLGPWHFAGLFSSSLAVTRLPISVEFNERHQIERERKFFQQDVILPWLILLSKTWLLSNFAKHTKRYHLDNTGPPSAKEFQGYQGTLVAYFINLFSALFMPPLVYCLKFSLMLCC